MRGGQSSEVVGAVLHLVHQRWGQQPLLESVGNLLLQKLEYQDHCRPIVVVALCQQPLVRFLHEGDDRQLALDARVERRPQLAL